MLVDTATVTSFDIERDNSPELANWAVFESGREVICVPPNWKAHLINQNDGQELVLLPPNSLDSIERVTFSSIIKDSPSLDYPAFAQKLAQSAFPNFRVVEGDTLKKLVFQKDFAIERNVGLLAHGKTYKGYCLTYVSDRKIYQFRIILDKERLKEYRGDLFRDIIGNLQIDKKYVVDNDNPLKQVINLR